MKSILTLGIVLGMATFAQASTISTYTYTLPTGSSLSGNYAFLYQVTASDLGLTSGQTIYDVSLDFNNIELVSYGQNTLHADLINGNYSSGSFYDNDYPSDYFTTHSFTYLHPASNDAIGIRTDLTRYHSRSWSWAISGDALTHLNEDLANFSAFDIGIDPDCHYDIGSIKISYKINSPSVPDTGLTAGLLGISFLGLIAFRRKFASR